MIPISLYRKTHDTFSFRPEAGPLSFVIGIPGAAAVDPAVEACYVGPADEPTHTFSPGGLYLAARGEMWGICIMEAMAIGAMPPKKVDPSSTPAVPVKRKRKRDEVHQETMLEEE